MHGSLSMAINFAEINYLAVVVAGLATFFLGGLWYSALFAKLWIKLHGYSEEKISAMKARMKPAVFFGGMIVCDLVIAFVVAILVGALNLRLPLEGALLGFLLWLGPAAAIQLTSQIASDKHFGLYLIDTSYQLIYLVMMGAILGGWR
jgi:hypothetical protein